MRLLAVSKLINQAVGDSFSGLLLVEAILKHMGWSMFKWNELYHDLPSRQLKVRLWFANSFLYGVGRQYLNSYHKFLRDYLYFYFCKKMEMLLDITDNDYTTKFPKCLCGI